MGNFIDLTNKQSGTLITKKYLGNSKWQCNCIKCGNTVVITTSWFNKNIKLKRDGCKHSKLIQIGDVFSNLTVIDKAPDYIKPKSKAHEKCWKCKCICGRFKNITEQNLKSGKSTSCGLCQNRISIPEKMIYFYLSKIFNNIEENYHPDFLEGKEIDIYIPELKLGIEYDGERWHQDVDSDIEKINICKSNGIILIRIREPKCPKINYDYCVKTSKPTTNGTHMTIPIRKTIELISKLFGLELFCDVDCLRDNAEICRTIFSTAGFNSVAIKYPEIAREWDYDKNYPLRPENIPAHSGKKVYWICPKGHNYSSVIASRTGNDNCGCPICANKGSSVYKNGVYVGERSLLKMFPDIAKEFNETKNGISADDISCCSNKKMWFKCSKCGYEWKTSVSNRTSIGKQGCPKCAREKVKLSKSKKVLCVETGIIYESISEAKRQTGISKISACCNGRQQIAGGYHWKFI